MMHPDGAAPAIMPSISELPDEGAPWMIEALRLLRTRDDPLRADGRGMLRLLHMIGSRATLLGLPWCGFFVGHCLRSALPEIVLPRLYIRARPWTHWGEAAEPQLGAVMLFWHVHPRSPLGHVGFYWAEDEDSYHVLSGNQRASIVIQRYPKSRLLRARWPAGVAQTGIRRRACASQAVPFP
ncbi:hypothetical protein [Profundibacterium mesophilum]|uniref:Peptidase C51 domain-containing protein n=1 Tax=Profundibacterium mesophilum KAUST100406-0324 TaxID=1037889 RepID=A0A921TCL3_9RHOB|nr:hypothetical protein [Profundibacterium mesophilum]KAF0675027.1 hypothetical protein PMES_02736 [Profundibacterium mesophilum KAUST100406-0324]